MDNTHIDDHRYVLGKDLNRGLGVALGDSKDPLGMARRLTLPAL
jgi:hypothetical protein